MCKLWRLLPLLLTLFACVQTPPETVSGVPSSNVQPSKPVRSPAAQRRPSFYRVEVYSQMAGFTLMVNGTELLAADGGKEYTAKTGINDWMISGNNEVVIDLFWPDGVKFSPGTSAWFRFFVNDAPLKEFRWPLAGAADTLASNSYTFRETFKADGFPRVQLETAEQVISHAGALSRTDQQEIASLAEELRRAFTEKNLTVVDGLMKAKYTDLALARFTLPAALQAEADTLYGALMGKEAYTVRPLAGRYSYASVADGRAVRLTQGRVGFPEPALVLTYRDGGKAVRYEQDLYFAKIDGRWLIIR